MLSFASIVNPVGRPGKSLAPIVLTNVPSDVNCSIVDPPKDAT